MSTRCLIGLSNSFQPILNENGEPNPEAIIGYRHTDGYPSSILPDIKNALMRVFNPEDPFVDIALGIIGDCGAQSIDTADVLDKHSDVAYVYSICIGTIYVQNINGDVLWRVPNWSAKT